PGGTTRMGRAHRPRAARTARHLGHRVHRAAQLRHIGLRMTGAAQSHPIRTALRRNAPAFAVIALLLAPMSIVVFSNMIAAGPRLVDDNQIYLLDRQIAGEGFTATAREHVRHRLGEMGRLVPVYLAHKLAQVGLLGTNLTAWGLY